MAGHILAGPPVPGDGQPQRRAIHYSRLQLLCQLGYPPLKEEAQQEAQGGPAAGAAPATEVLAEYAPQVVHVHLDHTQQGVAAGSLGQRLEVGDARA